MQKFFDVHTHAHLAAFDNDWKEVIERALSQDVGMINSGTEKTTSKRAVEIAHLFPEGVYASVGLYPGHTYPSYHDPKEFGGDAQLSGRAETFDFDFYRMLASDPKVVALGECGLDYYRLEEEDSESKKKKQREAFVSQIELSADIKKPLVIHCRHAARDLIEILKERKSLLLPEPGVAHFFTDGIEYTRELLDLGFSFSLGGVVTFARNYDETVRIIPDDRILSETDAPYAAPVPYRGRRNEPVYVIEAVKKLAEIRGVSTDEMASTIRRNVSRIFGI
jgi:TatD DNase family protein